jgi:hypothetical protein
MKVGSMISQEVRIVTIEFKNVGMSEDLDPCDYYLFPIRIADFRSVEFNRRKQAVELSNRGEKWSKFALSFLPYKPGDLVQPYWFTFYTDSRIYNSQKQLIPDVENGTFNTIGVIVASNEHETTVATIGGWGWS